MAYEVLQRSVATATAMVLCSPERWGWQTRIGWEDVFFVWKVADSEHAFFKKYWLNQNNILSIF